MTELIITEKPSAALKIATALADKTPVKNVVNKVPYYELTHKGKKIIVGCAVGHLYNLKETGKDKNYYPVFDLEWQPSHERKNNEFSKKYLTVLKKLSKEADTFIVACDYDIEGSVIGYNVIRYIAGKKDGKRMKFSTLTKDELIQSYEHASKHLDFPQIEAGITRHFMDYFWGVSLSRALMSSIKAAGMFKILSSGRVQGPALKIIVTRELEIKNFKSVPFYLLELRAKVDNKELIAFHIKDKIFDKKEAETIFKKTKNKKAIVEKIDKKEFLQPALNPFDLTTLQMEAYRCFNISPKETLSIAQNLYTNGLISYPRTSSQILPESIDYKKILKLISKNSAYKNLIKKLPKKLSPNNGKKTDPAHPAIYPTGELMSLTGDNKKIYDLIVRRFLTTFGEAAKRQTVSVLIDVNKEKFQTKGTITIELGWHIFYEPYLAFKEEELPKLKENQELKNYKIDLLEKETQPPRRYTQASIIKKLESLGLGTKATRANIIDSLYHRNYVMDKAITATELGIKIIEALQKFASEILDENLTRHFEEEMEQIQNSKKEKEEVLEEAQKTLTKIMEPFRKNEKAIGQTLLEATKETEKKASVIGKCRVCKKGDLVIKRGRFGNFVACNQYPKCKTTSSLPNNALIKPSDQLCKSCEGQTVLVIRKGRRPFNYCLNKECPAKKEWLEKFAKA